MWQRIAALSATFFLMVGAITVASSPAPTTEPSWCRTVDQTTGEVVTFECFFDPQVEPPPPEEPPEEPPPPTEPPPAGGEFVATFDGNTGLEAFDMGVFHRNRDVQGGGSTPDSWTGDHDLSCGPPSTQRTLNYHPDQTMQQRIDNAIYLCRDHMMTSMGDVDGYSIVWLTPNQSFTGGEVTSVSWDVNVTDLKARQWWEVALIPDGDPHLATIPLVAGAANIDPYSPGSIAIGNGPFGGDKPSIYANQTQHYSSGRKWCHSDVWSRAGDGTGGVFDACDDKTERVTFTLTDNLDGTLTIVWGDDEQGTVERYEQTFPGAFPDTFHVYFKDHNYTPDKGGAPIGYTWHWDNIIVQ